MRYKQGMSEISTPRKQRNLRHLTKLRLGMLHRRLGESVSRLRIRDAFCGDGENVIEGELIDGSPQSILRGIQDATVEHRDFRASHHLIECRFSDTREVAISQLSATILESWNVIGDFFAHNSFSGLAETEKMDAVGAIAADSVWLSECRRRRLFLVLDPNGPSHFPYLDVQRLLTGPARSRVDVVIHVSAGAIKRVLGHMPAQKSMSEWFGSFETMFVKALAADERAWVRVPAPGDSGQWCIMVYWSKPTPESDWRNAGFYMIGSDEGRRAIDAYTKTNEEKRR